MSGEYERGRAFFDTWLTYGNYSLSDARHELERLRSIERWATDQLPVKAGDRALIVGLRKAIEERHAAGEPTHYTERFALSDSAQGEITEVALWGHSAGEFGYTDDTRRWVALWRPDVDWSVYQRDGRWDDTQRKYVKEKFEERIDRTGKDRYVYPINVKYIRRIIPDPEPEVCDCCGQEKS